MINLKTSRGFCRCSIKQKYKTTFMLFFFFLHFKDCKTKQAEDEAENCSRKQKVTVGTCKLVEMLSQRNKDLQGGVVFSY